MFEDRVSAGRLLAERLSSLKKKFDVVLGIPRGGVVVAKEISKKFDKPLGVVNAKKIPTPGQPELASGARIVKDRGFGQTPNIKGKSVVLVDDGVATGATIKAAIKYLRKKKAVKIILAVPIAPPEVWQELEPLVEEVAILAIPENFASVGQFYLDFPQVEDEEVVQLLQK